MNQSEIVGKVTLWREKPHVMVNELFGVDLDPWQLDGLKAFPSSKYMAMKACKGPGKTALLAWLSWNFLLTRPSPKIAATSISSDNMRDNLWAEMAKWRERCPLLKAMFTWTNTRIFLNENPENWWMSARSWSRSATASDQALTLAGLHADYLLFLLDEAGGIPSSVMVAAEAGLSTGVESHLVIAGNPTHLEGPLYDACNRDRASYKLIEITGDPDDPKRSTRVDIGWARDQIQKYGRDNPWVLVNVFGQFPPSSMQSLIGPDEVSAAMKRHYDESQYDFAARLLGVDVARQGDDPTVIFPRQGLAAFMPMTMRIPDTMQIAGHVANKWESFKADGVFIDATGGYGAGVIDALRAMNRAPFSVQYAGTPTDMRYGNIRAEILMRCVQWVKDGGALPPVPELVAEMSSPQTYFKGDRMFIEAKDQVKARIGRSTDYFDALAQTFLFPVQKGQYVDAGKLTALGIDNRQVGHAVTEYDPYSDERLNR